MNICIAHGGTIAEPGGGTDRITAFCSGLSKEHNVTLVVPEFDGEPPSRLDETEIIEVSASESRIIEALRLARAAHRAAARRDAILQFEHSVLGGFGALTGRREFIVDMHDLAFPRYDHTNTKLAPLLKHGVRYLEKLGVTTAEHTVVVSDTMGEIIEGLWDIPPSCTSVVPNGYFKEKVKQMSTEKTVSGRVVFLGTLHPKVDVDAIQEVAQLPAVKELFVIGDGYHRDRLDSLAVQNGMEALNVMGSLPDEEAFSLVSSSEIAINPQKHSALQRTSSPVKFNYYAALGTPMVISSGPDSAEKLEEAGAAILVGPDENFAESIPHLLRNEELKASMARNAKEISNELTWSKRTKQIEESYLRATGSKNHHP